MTLPVLVDGVQVYCGTVGQGDLVLGPPLEAAFGIERLSDSALYRYALVEGRGLEVGHGTYNANLGTLTRTVEKSTDGDGPLALKGGATVSFTVTAADVLAGRSGEDPEVLNASLSSIISAAILADGEASVDVFGLSEGVTKRATLGAFMVALLTSTSAQAMRMGAGLGSLKTLQDFGAKCDGITNDAASLLSASTAALPVLHRTGTMRIATAMTVGAPLYPDPAAVIMVDGVTLTLAGGFSAVGLLTFSCVNGGKVVFADGVVDEVDVRWWGFASNVTAAVNDAAIKAARDSITTRGKVRFPPGAFPVTAYTPINRSFIDFLGDGAFGTTLLPSAGAGDVTGIDGTLQPGFVSGASPYIDRCTHQGISVYRGDSQSATCSFDSERRPTSIPTGSRGFVHRYASNATIRAVLQSSAIDYYEAQTTGADIELKTVRVPLAGDATTTLRFGLVSDCTIAGLPGTSSNGSSYKTLIDVVAPNVTAETWGVLVLGSDLRDHFWKDLETAGGTHAVDCVVPGTGTPMAWDIHVRSVILDSWSASGLRLLGLPGGSRFNVVDGYSAPGVTGSGPSVDIAGSSGAVLGEGFEAKGGVDYANHIGVRLRVGAARCTIRAAVTGCAYGVVVDNSPFNIIAPSVEALSGQTVTAAITLQNGASRNLIEGYRVSGDQSSGGITDGVVVDAASSYNTIGAGLLAVGNISGAPVRISGAAVIASGRYNNNKVTDGAIAP